MDTRQTKANPCEEIESQPSRRTGAERPRAGAELKDDPGDTDPNCPEDTEGNPILDLPP